VLPGAAALGDGALAAIAAAVLAGEGGRRPWFSSAAARWGSSGVKVLRGKAAGPAAGLLAGAGPGAHAPP
jgi:hypothetical protein